MKVLFLVNVPEGCLNASAPSSGAERQVFGLMDALSNEDCEVGICNLFNEVLPYDELRDYNAVHIFNSAAPKGVLLNAVEVLQRFYNKRVFFTPTWWPRDDVIFAAKTLSTEKCKVEVINDVSDMSVLSDICSRSFLLVSSHSEYQQIEKHLLSKPAPYAILPNAIDTRELDEVLPKLNILHDYVMCAGRVELRKNQHSLIDAMRKLKERGYDWPLVLVGSVDEAYVKLWKSEGVHVQHIPHSPPAVVYSIMKGSRVYVQPSFYETPGLASLEAAALGCAVVVGNRGAESEYFGDDLVSYCDPGSAESIARALVAAIQSGPNPRLRVLVRELFTYKHATQAALRAYRGMIT